MTIRLLESKQLGITYKTSLYNYSALKFSHKIISHKYFISTINSHKSLFYIFIQVPNVGENYFIKIITSMIKLHYERNLNYTFVNYNFS